MTITITWTTLLWVLAALVLLAVAWRLWRRSRPVQPPIAEFPEMPMSPPAEPVARTARTPTAAPPPAMAGQTPQQGTAAPGGATGTPRAPIAAPPPASAGGGAAGMPASAPASGRPRTAAPPPAAAGGGVPSSPPGTNARRTPSVAPPPAAAGGQARPPAAASDERTARPRAETPRRAREASSALTAVSSWGYQLQKLDIAKAAASPFEVLVVDYSKDGSDEKALKSADLARLKAMPDGRQRILLAYLSIGEAESYRYYWEPGWTKDRPAWLLSENPEWKENYAVCYWDPGWQQLICGTPGSYLDRIIAQGFDGVYLDKCDVFEDLGRREKKAARSRPDLEGDMVAFVERLSRHAKSKRPGFLVVMQNAENLLEHEALVAAIDGVAKEELVFGLDGPERRNPKGEIEDARKALDLARRAGKAVLVVEYLDNPAKITEADAITKAAGYVLYVAPKDRELDRLNYVVLEA